MSLSHPLPLTLTRMCRRAFIFTLTGVLAASASPGAGRAADRAAFPPLARPAVPTVKDTTWARNPVDRFILAKLEEAGLRPTPPADRQTLLRRVTFDLTGLAPTPAEREAFLADTSPDA